MEYYNYFDPTNPSHMELVTMMMQFPEFSGSLPPSVPNFSGQNPPPHPSMATTLSFSPSPEGLNNPSVAAMREVIFRIAAMQPVHIDPEAVKAPKRRNVRISKDPQSIAARHRRERISERIRILQRLVPGGTKMDTASMLDEAIHYVKFLKSQVQCLERVATGGRSTGMVGYGFPGGSGGLGSSNNALFR